MKRYMTLLIVISTITCYGQKPLENYYLKRSLKQEGLHFTFTVLDDDKNGIRNYSKEKFYFWYKSQIVLSTQGASSGLLLHGEFEAFHSNKQLARKGRFTKGLKDGEWLYWRWDGTLIKKEQWSNGSQRGIQIYFDERGIEVESINVRSLSVEKKYQDTIEIIRGSRKEIKIYDSVGRIKRREKYKNDTLHGKIRTYSDGKKSSIQKFKSGIEFIKEDKSKVESVDDVASKKESKIGLGLSKVFAKKSESKIKSEKEKRKKRENKN